MRTSSVSIENRFVSLTVHGDTIGGLGGKADLVKYPPGLMVVNDCIWLFGQPYYRKWSVKS